MTSYSANDATVNLTANDCSSFWKKNKQFQVNLIQQRDLLFVYNFYININKEMNKYNWDATMIKYVFHMLFTNFCLTYFIRFDFL